MGFLDRLPLIPALLAPLLSILTKRGLPLRAGGLPPIALVINPSAAFLSRLAVSRKSMVFPCFSMAR